jgi:hypothetical protein
MRPTAFFKSTGFDKIAASKVEKAQRARLSVYGRRVVLWRRDCRKLAIFGADNVPYAAGFIQHRLGDDAARDRRPGGVG